MRSWIENLEARIVFDDHTGGIVTGSFPGSGSTPSGPPTLHVIPIPSTATPVSTAVLGTFGGSGKAAHYSLTTSAGVAVSMTLTGGTATIYQDGAGYHLTISASGSGAVFSVVTHKGGVELTNINVSGSLKSMTAKSASLTGTLAVSGTIGTLSVGSVSGAITAGGGSIGKLSAGSLSDAIIISGANLGADGRFGGTGGNADNYGAGSIGSVTVTGSVTDSIVAAGLNPVNGVFLDSDDVVVGGTASSIHSVVVKGSVDSQTRFIAGAFGTAKVPKPVKPASDPNFATS